MKKRNILFFLILILFFEGCANKQITKESLQEKNNTKVKMLENKFNKIELTTVKECAKFFGKTLETANSSELYCKNFMLYMKKLNKNSMLFCKSENIEGLKPYQCYEVATIGFELKKKYNITNINYKKIASIYKRISLKYQKYGRYSTTNLMLKENIINNTIKEYIANKN